MTCREVVRLTTCITPRCSRRSRQKSQSQPACDMLPFHLVYHEGYDLNLGSHVFPSQKFRLIRERLLAEDFAAPEDFVAPEPPPDEDLLLVHEPGWVERLKTGALSYEEIMQLEIPYSPEMARAFCLPAGGTTLAARTAPEQGVACNVCRGLHPP